MSFPTWNNDFNKLYEALQDAYGSSTEEYNHIISKILNQMAASQIYVFDGIAYILDPIRGKYLSTGRTQLSFGYYGPNQSSRYLRVEGVTTSGNGWMMMRNATLTGLCTRSRSSTTYQLQIRKNDVTTPIQTIVANAGSGVSDTLDVNVNKGDYVQLFIDGTAIDHPLAFLELAWRYDT